MIGLKCVVCGKIKIKTEFRSTDRDKPNPVCINCQPNFKLRCEYGMKQERVVKNCINCKEDFYSINDYRTCGKCRKKLKRKMKYFD